MSEWVATRDGHVVLHNPSLEALVDAVEAMGVAGLGLTIEWEDDDGR